MHDMLQRRWGTKTGPRLFASRGREAFTRAVLHRMVVAKLAHLATLTADGQRIAVSLELRLGSRYYSLDAAFDPDFAQFGIGQAQLYEVLCHSLAAGATEVDLMAGDFPYKRRWANAERVSRSHVLVAPGRVGYLDRVARRVAMSLRFRRMRRWEQQRALDDAFGK